MGVFFWLMWHVSGAAWLFFRVLLPLWNFFWSNLEAMVYLGKRRQAVAALKTLRSKEVTSKILATWYREKKFRWRQDLLRGKLDFSSKPWVSVARNKGDCDDMMVIAEYVLKDKYDEGHKSFVYSSDGRAHAVYLFRADEEWFAMSNQFAQGPFSSKEAAVERTFGEKTTFSYVA